MRKSVCVCVCARARARAKLSQTQVDRTEALSGVASDPELLDGRG